MPSALCAALRAVARRSPGSSEVRITDSSSVIGFARTTVRLAGWSSDRPKESGSFAGTSDEVHASDSPNPARSTRMRRSAAWSGSRPPDAPFGRVAGSLSKPSRRATSSIRSTSRSTSRRKVGTSTLRTLLLASTSKPTDRRWATWVSVDTSYPRRCSVRPGRSVIVVRSGGLGYLSVTSEDDVPPATSVNSAAARAAATPTFSGSTPLSKRAEASV